MLPFQWNALRAGDHVLVHDDSDPEFALTDGVVEFVLTRVRACNELAIRLTVTPSRVVRPRRQAVHMTPRDRQFECWRCDSVGARGNPSADRVAA